MQANFLSGSRHRQTNGRSDILVIEVAGEILELISLVVIPLEMR